MRGFPLLRSLLILALLALSGLGLARLTTTPPADGGKQRPVAGAPKDTLTSSIPYRLVLSAEAREIAISSGHQSPLATVTGNLPHSSLISLTVRWKNPPTAGEQRFAKLILEPAGKPTITHVFDSSGDIDDILELP